MFATNRGGALVRVEGLRGFIPGSHISTRKPKEDLVADFLPLKFLEVDEERNRLVLSHRRALVERKMNRLEVGEVVIGTVRGIKPYGAFIDIGGVSGLLHISEISHEHIETPHTVLNVNDQMKVMIIDLDAERGRISLSTKALEPEPGDMLTDPAEGVRQGRGDGRSLQADAAGAGRGERAHGRHPRLIRRRASPAGAPAESTSFRQGLFHGFLPGNPGRPGPFNQKSGATRTRLAGPAKLAIGPLAFPRVPSAMPRLLLRGADLGDVEAVLFDKDGTLSHQRTRPAHPGPSQGFGLFRAGNAPAAGAPSCKTCSSGPTASETRAGRHPSGWCHRRGRTGTTT